MGSDPNLDATHDPGLRSWVESANEPGCDFPIQNLPFGIFKRKGAKESPRGGVAIGDQILDLAALDIKTGPTLNGIASLGRPAWKRLRSQLSKGLSKAKPNKRFSRYLVPIKQAQLFLPLAIGDYTDFYSGIHHATNIGKILRPDNPLLPNYKWVPIGYHGRSSSIVASGTQVVRPRGQVKPPEQEQPTYGPTRRLDYEAELGFVVGPGNRLGKPIALRDALNHVFTVSPWIVTFEALAPYRCPAFPRAAGDPRPLPYLWDDEDQRAGGLAIDVEMHLRTAKMQAPVRLSRGSFRDSYWTVAQLVAHHTSNGCNLRPGDLLGSGTLSGATPDSYGSLMELTQGGKQPLTLPSGETRAFLEDGDEVVQKGYGQGDGIRIGFGEAAGLIKS